MRRRIFWGIDNAPPAFDFSAYAPVAREHQLRTRLVPEVWRGHQQWGWASEARNARTVTQDRRCLRAVADASDGAVSVGEAEAARHLLDRLKPGTPNLAGPHFDSRVGNCLGSHTLAAVEALSPKTPIFHYTVLSDRWRMPLSLLPQFDPSQVFNALRSHLYRTGLHRLSGWGILSLHGEHQPDGTIDPHIHALTVGDKHQAFDDLREHSMFEGGEGKLIKTPVLGRPLANPPRQISYLIQHAWSYKAWSGGRGGRRSPPALAHGRYLVWRAHQRVSDLVWMHGVRLREGHLRPD